MITKISDMVGPNGQVIKTNTPSFFGKIKNIASKTKHIPGLLTGGLFAGDAAYRIASGDASLGGSLAGASAGWAAFDKLNDVISKAHSKIKNPWIRRALWLPKVIAPMIGSGAVDSVVQTAADRFTPIWRRKLVAPNTVHNNIKTQPLHKELEQNITAAGHYNQLSDFSTQLQNNMYNNNKLVRADSIAGTHYLPHNNIVKTSELKKISGLLSTINRKLPRVVPAINKFTNAALSTKAIPYYVGGGIGVGLGTHWGIQAFNDKQREFDEQSRFIEQYKKQQQANMLNQANMPYLNSQHFTTQN